MIYQLFTMSKQHSPKQLAKLIEYILRRRPDEFGLVPDEEGFISLKELLKALNEEEGFRYVRRSHLDEIMLTVPEHSLEVADNRIRSKFRDQLPRPVYARNLPKLLYVCVRRKAHPHVAEKGVQPADLSRVVLSSDIAMAERLGRRIDRSAVLLTVQVQPCTDRGAVFFQAGETLFLADFIPAGCFTGPPLPKEKPAAAKPAESTPAQQQPPAGSYLIDLGEKYSARVPKSKRRAPDADGQKAGDRRKKQKRRREKPPWRR
jgi:putative RNA 2'-phosphotransferase